MSTRYVCINGHDLDKPGRVIAWFASYVYHECSWPSCGAEAEPVTEAERDEIKARRDARDDQIMGEWMKLKLAAKADPLGLTHDDGWEGPSW